MYKIIYIRIKNKFLQFTIIVAAITIASVVLNFQIRDSTNKRSKTNQNRELFHNNYIKSFLCNDPPETKYLVVKATEDYVSSHELMTDLATLVSNKLATINTKNPNNLDDLKNFIPYILEHKNAVINSAENGTITSYVMLLTNFLSGKKKYTIVYDKTSVEELISMKMCDILVNENVDQLKSVNPFIKINDKYEINSTYSIDFVKLAVKTSVYEYLEHILVRLNRSYSLYWKETVSDLVTKIFIGVMENNSITAKNLVSVREEFEVTLNSLGQFLYLDLNQDNLLSPNELINIFSLPNTEDTMIFIPSLFKTVLSGYGFNIDLFDFIVFKFSAAIIDDVVNEELINIVRL